MKIAGVQWDPKLGEVEANLQRMIDFHRQARAEAAELTVFPECALTGYCFTSREEALPFAQTIPGRATETMQRACRDLGGGVIFGLLEREGDRLFNALAFICGEGLVGSYRKVHLPYLGVDMFTDYGDRPFAVQEFQGVRIGMSICYDGGFPESARCLTLLGADVVVLPTNWPPGAECAADHTSNTRAMENIIYFMAVNRVGTERDVTFIGGSRICDPLGKTMATADRTSETILYAEIDAARARNKRLIRVPGKNEVNRIADRRPEMYGPLVEPHNLQRIRDLE
jgi:predicted amidohydrolase